MRPLRLAGALLVVAASLLARRAEAHAIGLSTGTWTSTGAALEGKLVLARSELLGAPEAEARRLVATGVTVTAAGAPCPGEVTQVAPADNDGVAVSARWTCPTADAKHVTLSLLRELPRGHRHVAQVTAGAGTSERVLHAGEDAFDVAASAAPAPGAPTTSPLAFFRMGVEHILTGYDHLVFLLGLVLARARLRSVLAVVTAFTVAHSITLALAALGVWAPSPRLVEPAIALSIAYVGVENFFVTNATNRWRITFPFGLIHGFGFAGALEEVALPRAQVPAALVSFNLGVEAGQLAALALVLPLVWALRSRTTWFASRGVRLASAAVAAAGGVWFVSRILS